MLDAVVAFEAPDAHWNESWVQKTRENPPVALLAKLYRQWETKDAGKPIVITFVSRKEWFGLCDAIKRPEWKTDPRFASGSKETILRLVSHEIKECIKSMPRDEILARMSRFNVPAGPVNSYEDLLKHPQV